MAVRLSLGASRRQLLAQLLTESSCWRRSAGVVGLVVAQWTLAVIASLLPAEAASTLTVRPAAGR